MSEGGVPTTRWPLGVLETAPLQLRLQDNPHRTVEVGGGGEKVGNVRPARKDIALMRLHKDVKGGDHFCSSCTMQPQTNDLQLLILNPL